MLIFVYTNDKDMETYFVVRDTDHPQEDLNRKNIQNGTNFNR